jgi:hypothetical protein
VLYRLPELRAADPKEPVFVTEGEKDADRLADLGLVATTNVGGAGKWRTEYTEELQDRVLVLLEDNDAAGHGHVQKIARSAHGHAAGIRILKLPSLPDGGDVSDWLENGGSGEQLRTLVEATPEWKPEPDRGQADARPACPYRQTQTGLVWEKSVRDGTVGVPLTNFRAKIIEDRSEDDGLEAQRILRITASLGSRERTFDVPASQFAGMNWPVAHLGADAVVFPGFTIKDHTRAAVQLLSAPVPEKTVFTHLGWRKLHRGWAFLHAGGAIGTQGTVGGVEVDVPGELQRCVLPAPPLGDELLNAVRACLGVLDVVPPRTAFPLLAAVFRSPLGGCDFALALTGPTGTGKTELAALAQQHFGPELDARHLPANWSSTANALEGVAFAAKDSILVVDDFSPGGSMYDVQRLHREADRLLRGQGNASGRQRMRSDGSLRPTKSPRGLIISTGEDVPRGQSLRARMLVLEVGPNDVDWSKLTECQSNAADGLYAAAMAGYLQWLAGRMDDIHRTLRGQIVSLRSQATTSAQHRRTPEIVANLALGFRYFLEFAQTVGVIGSEDASDIEAQGWHAFGEIADQQHQHQRASEPTAQFLGLLQAAISSGRAHVVGPDGAPPEQPETWGWRERTIGAGTFERAEWQPQGDCVGWIDGDDLYLEPEASFATVQRMAHDGGDSLSVGIRTLLRRMDERRLLRSRDGDRLTTRRTLQGRKRAVLHLHSDLLGEKACPTCPPCSTSADLEDVGTFSGHGSTESIEKRAPETCINAAEKPPLGTECTLGTVLGDKSAQSSKLSDTWGEI